MVLKSKLIAKKYSRAVDFGFDSRIWPAGYSLPTPVLEHLDHYFAIKSFTYIGMKYMLF